MDIRACSPRVSKGAVCERGELYPVTALCPDRSANTVRVLLLIHQLEWNSRGK